MDRKVLRKKAQKAYKEQAKSVPKNMRVSFAEFWKRYLKADQATKSDDNVEDFDINEVVQVNDLKEQ